jgi:hypothetical protein
MTSTASPMIDSMIPKKCVSPLTGSLNFGNNSRIATPPHFMVRRIALSSD